MKFLEALDRTQTHHAVRVAGRPEDTLVWAALHKLFAQTGCRHFSSPADRGHDLAGLPIIPAGVTRVVLACDIADHDRTSQELLLHVLANTPSSAQVLTTPQSYALTDDRFWDRLARFAGKRVVFFARDEISYATLARRDLPAWMEVHLDDDLGLGLGGLPEQRPCFFGWRSFRRDAEAAGLVPPAAHDMPLRDVDVADLAVDFAGLVEVVSGCSHVWTDYLHLATLAALLGKHVWLFPCSYHKNRAVYERSLRSRFPTLTFVTEREWGELATSSAPPGAGAGG